MSNIVLDEKKWAEEAIASSGFIAGQMETLIRLAKYYAYLGQGKSEARRSLGDFMNKHGEDPSTMSSQLKIENAIKLGFKHPLFVSSGVTITDAELKTISGLDSAQLKRLAFTLLCLSKYLDQKRKNNNGWVSTPDNDIVRMANMKPSVKKQSELFSKLEKAGLIRFSRHVADLSVQVLFQQAGMPAMEVSDFRNLGYQYMSLGNPGYYTCKNCGLTLKTDAKKKGPKFKYCPDCAKKISLSQRVNSVMRQRGIRV